jgi:hypothetical protein
MERAEKGERERYPVRWSDLGAVEYEWALAEQKRLAEERAKREADAEAERVEAES